MRGLDWCCRQLEIRPPPTTSSTLFPPFFCAKHFTELQQLSGKQWKVILAVTSFSWLWRWRRRRRLAFFWQQTLKGGHLSSRCFVCIKKNKTKKNREKPGTASQVITSCCSTGKIMENNLWLWIKNAEPGLTPHWAFEFVCLETY